MDITARLDGGGKGHLCAHASAPPDKSTPLMLGGKEGPPIPAHGGLLQWSGRTLCCPSFYFSLVLWVHLSLSSSLSRCLPLHSCFSPSVSQSLISSLSFSASLLLSASPLHSLNLTSVRLSLWVSLCVSDSESPVSLGISLSLSGFLSQCLSIFLSVSLSYCLSPSLSLTSLSYPSPCFSLFLPASRRTCCQGLNTHHKSQR